MSSLLAEQPFAHPLAELKQTCRALSDLHCGPAVRIPAQSDAQIASATPVALGSERTPAVENPESTERLLFRHMDHRSKLGHGFQWIRSEMELSRLHLGH
mmetsp:Transcript_31857/g.48046  ORF Transcript_31857/g.48046 Transcript_31857/m.48046 type:complete len:100 (+) Transcript_31857:182-481(+)